MGNSYVGEVNPNFYKTNAWERFMKNTGSEENFVNKSHYRNPSKIRIRHEEEGTILLNGDSSKGTSSRYTAKSSTKRKRTKQAKRKVLKENNLNNSQENISFKPLSSNILCEQDPNQMIIQENNYNEPQKKPNQRDKKRSLSKTFTSTFKLGYTEEEQRAAPAFERKLSCKVNIETKHPKEAMIGVSSVGYMKDAAVHKRGRSSHASNSNTYFSQVRYLPGSIKDEDSRARHHSTIRLDMKHPNKECRTGSLIRGEDPNHISPKKPRKKHIEPDYTSKRIGRRMFKRNIKNQDSIGSITKLGPQNHRACR